ncbi:MULTISPECIES: PEP-CTERM sorting domain-containing protein [unclassified Janthinobacterium]|uniref:PEP-CTERM sorting domain-containing protein n=1 Tax=unclassified Janthinobacterium TaxID=2610881 RepID=UPI0008913BF9|nr:MULTISPECIES: PEP-CTERM sorting domain-containing protein [unclassified Janthinobacterium]SDA72902.1 PEP-CTERM protein-sorting domain-containing protein [Janthinobacterium sp. 551a]SFB53957.1 PEP-CTERM protein-sorting domain-containing protein [Janthinobacterium sp. 344]
MKRLSMLSVRTCTPPSMASSRRTPTTAPAAPEKSVTARQRKTMMQAARTGILAGLLALPAMAQATVIEFSVSGIVAQGVDELHLFSDYGESLVGKPYTMKFLLDTATLAESQSGNIHGASNSTNGAPVYFSGEITMGSRRYNWTLDPDGYASMYLLPTSNIMMQSSGGYGFGQYKVSSMLDVSAGGSTPYFDTAEFEQRIEFKDFVDPWGYSSEFQLTYTAPRYPDDHGAYVAKTNFVGTGTYALWQVREVPEPGQVGMLLAGAALLIGVARRERRRA